MRSALQSEATKETGIFTAPDFSASATNFDTGAQVMKVHPPAMGVLGDGVTADDSITKSCVETATPVDVSTATSSEKTTTLVVVDVSTATSSEGTATPTDGHASVTGSRGGPL